MVHEHRRGSVPMPLDVTATDSLGTGLTVPAHQDALLIRWWHALPR
ncbi:hypothetical protein GCM10009706_06720 [Curtobacterium citreum]|uniref:Uncharacterized protein n=1 Tax=Curtobacterium citreum TaxID=2036 RepID=A0ABT2HCT7_9MICO|nr:hypothetical protein [Curtobacterium citreum]MCS6521059.1 hypothetical protein [Curtobacterium citreum]TQJ27913.1 hypothetical protein FB462_1781 [Curtobacterium citreum]GGL71091.1 hypothetical protein GCM10009706_06720 [Curtobacterium citreum]